MRFYVDKEKPNRSMEIYLSENSNNIVSVMGKDYLGRSWILFTFKEDGSFIRMGSIQKDTGLRLDYHGRIVEDNEEKK